MKIVFVSNYYNHHQAPLCRELDRITGHNFWFISTSEMREERKRLGYGEDAVPNYVLKAHASEFARNRAKELIFEADVAIAGSTPEDMIQSRIKSGKLTFRYSERPLKNGNEPLKYIPRLVRWHRRNPSKKNIYLLSAGGYTAAEYRKFFLFKNRAFKWGYFPETKEYSAEKLFVKKDVKRILWCGRFLDWKHPDDALYAAKRLKDEGYSFELDFIGTGALEAKLKQTAEDWQLGECVRFLGSMKPEQVRGYMESSGIYLFTSDRKEGWGAVLNESMNSGCAVIASDLIGSVPFLMKDGENGLVYESGNREMLIRKLKYLLDNPNIQKELGKSAYCTITEIWCASVAAERLVKLAQRILDGESYPRLYEEGPCSRD